jgi:hypothetical protein
MYKKLNQPKGNCNKSVRSDVFIGHKSENPPNRAWHYLGSDL